MRPCCSHATASATRCDERAERQIQRRARYDRRRRLDSAARGRTGVGSSRRIAKKGWKMWRIGCPNPSAVSCMRAFSRANPQSHGARAAHAPVIEDAAPPRRSSEHDRHDRQQEHQRSVATLWRSMAGTSSHQAAADASERRPSRAASDTMLEQRDDLRRQQARAATQPDRQPHQPDALEPAGVVRRSQARPRAAGRGRSRRRT